MFLTDSHAHLDFIENLEHSLDNAKSNGLGKIITIGTSIGASEKCIDIAEKFSSPNLEIFATIGIHAEDGKKDLERYGQNYIEKLKGVALSSKRVVGIGECGFDIRESTDNSEIDSHGHSPWSSLAHFALRAVSSNASPTAESRGPRCFAIDFQRDLFENQIKLAQELNLPLVIHCRNAWEKTFNTISNVKFQRSNVKLRGVFHSFTGGVEEMQKAIELGFYVSFSGIVTFKNAGEIAQAAKKIPLERMLVETDSPFLSPEPLRGKKNEPKNVRITAQFLAQLRNQSQNLLIEATTRNAHELFHI